MSIRSASKRGSSSSEVNYGHGCGLPDDDEHENAQFGLCVWCRAASMSIGQVRSVTKQAHVPAPHPT